MSLRHKILWSIIAVLLILLVVLSFFMSIISLQRFIEIEEKTIERNLERLQYLIEEELNHLTVHARNYAVWDQTYNYIHSPTESYLIENFSDTNLESLNLNWMALLGLEGKIIFGRHNMLEHDTIDSTTDFLKYDLTFGLNFEKKSAAGILSFSHYPMLFASHVILNSQREGPVRGSLMVGRYLTTEKLQAISKQLQLNIKMQTLNKHFNSSNFEDAWQQLQQQHKTRLVKSLSAKEAAGYLLLHDINQQPSLIFEIIFPREIYQQGLINVYYISGAIIITGIFFIVILLLLIDKLILSRLTELSQSMSDISLEPKQLQVLKTDDYGDELTQLTITINNMLLSLHDNHQRLKHNETRLKTAQRIAHVGHWEWNLHRDEHYWSEELFNLLKLSPKKDEINQHLFLKHIPISEQEMVQFTFTKTIETGQANELEHHIIDAQGQTRIFHTRIECINGFNTSHHHVIATIQYQFFQSRIIILFK
ncbi:CHASE4 domain-containing protein [Thioflexithrix psekupsensis]|uniref:HAMP domain-containing protein n=1 Tax=Thioflexithrix psekupsensis TaxID=1570016 RepID=A0A251X7S8_9GAMM|nr:CHASE4 domain-containing protein [Thioflexithrix psekupsensis]OUD14109.1 hypothetical protein TPSD3_07150 [Thioflexithrix psekupsensis]